ncbi:TonB-dependent receptor [Rubrivirga sp.]|uniref:TonB-dependent receptor n=1 Tax=Rubrivirga sp. TaxID=1885344 RepID=UPI003B52FB74
MLSLRLLAVALGLVAVGTADAQSLSGRVVDAETGAPLPGAAVRVLDRGTATDADGRFALAGLPADTATVAVTFVGYQPWRETVDLGRTASLDVRLAPAADVLGEVEVSADAAQEALGRDVRAVAVLEGRALEEMRGQTLAETLDGLNGVTTLSTGPTIGKPVVRGLHSDRVVILENGVRQEGQQWGGEHAPEIDPFSAGRIEVVKGAAGVEYGAGAIGGVVRLDDRDLPTEPGLGGRLGLQAFSNSGQGAGSLVLEDAPAGLPGVAWRLQGSFRRAGDARTPDVVIRNSAFREASGHLTVGYQRGPLALDGHLRRYDTELGIYKGSHFGNARNLEAIIARGGPDPDWDYRFSYDIEAPKQRVTHDVASVHGHTTFGDGHHVDAQYAVQNNRRREFDAHRPYSDSLAALGSRPSFDLSLLTQSVDLKLEPSVSDRARLAVGVQARTQLNENGESGTLVPNFRAYDGGLFTHGSWAASPALTLDAGLRLDARTMTAYPLDRASRRVRADTRTFLGGAAAVGALYALGEHWSVAANAGSAWRPPNVSELYSFGVHHGTAQFEIGDPDLGTERSLDLSATVRHESALASAEVSGYVNHIADYIYALETPEPTVTIRGTFPTFETTHTDARLAGVDANVEVRPTGWLDLGARASVLRADNLDLGGPLYGVPSDRVGAHARATAGRLLGLADAYAEADVQHVARQDRVQPGAYLAAPYPPGYTLAGLRLGATLDWNAAPVQLQLGIDNLFDVRYRDALGRFRYFVDEPGRNVTLRVSVPLG